MAAVSCFTDYLTPPTVAATLTSLASAMSTVVGGATLKEAGLGCHSDMHLGYDGRDIQANYKDLFYFNCSKHPQFVIRLFSTNAFK